VTDTSCLPEIPVIDLGRAGPLALLEAEQGRAEWLLAAGRRRYTAAFLRFADGLSERWLARNETPFDAEIAAIAARLGRRGTVFLNASYEWSCSSGVATNAQGGTRLLRVLDWPFEGLGRHVVAARATAPAGPWINLTWPGFVGCVQGLAPGRFAAALNQGPLTRRSASFLGDWLLERRRIWRQRAMPPTHLLRQVFETAPDYGAAKAALCDSPLASPTIFTLGGPEAGCVIERYEDQARVYEAPVASANHWLGGRPRARSRGPASKARQALLSRQVESAGDDFAWLEPPLLNGYTRLAVIAEAATGRLAALGIEGERPATQILRLDRDRAAPSDGAEMASAGIAY
jgi:hypothetical protein